MTSSISDPTHGDPARELVVDASPDLDPATFDLDAWINGATSTVRAVTLYQRPDLMAEVDALQRELRIAEAIPDEDRGMNDTTPAGIRSQLEQTAREFERSALVFKVESRSDGHRERIAKHLKKQGITDENEVVLHQLADAIIEPKGVTVDFLRKLQDRSEAQVKLLVVASTYANTEPPRVTVPFSNGSSGSRKRAASS